MTILDGVIRAFGVSALLVVVLCILCIAVPEVGIWWRRRKSRRPIPHFLQEARFVGAMWHRRKKVFRIEAPNDRVCAEYLAWICADETKVRP